MAKIGTRTLTDLARCERSRVSRRSAIGVLVGGLVIAGVGGQIVQEREILYRRQRHRRPYAAIRRRSTTVKPG